MLQVARGRPTRTTPRAWWRSGDSLCLGGTTVLAMRFARLGAVVGTVAVLSTVLAPAALAQGRGGMHNPTSRGPEGGFFHQNAPAVPPFPDHRRRALRRDRDTRTDR